MLSQYYSRLPELVSKQSKLVSILCELVSILSEFVSKLSELVLVSGDGLVVVEALGLQHLRQVALVPRSLSQGTIKI